MEEARRLFEAIPEEDSNAQDSSIDESPPPPTSDESWLPELGAACSGFGDNCSDTRCCNVTWMKCYEKDKYWAGCRHTCEPGNRYEAYDPEGFKTEWTCKLLGGSTPPPPTLYCFEVMLASSSEVSLVRLQLDSKTSIFGCDAYEVFSDTTGLGVDVTVVKGPLRCAFGGRCHQALSAGVFFDVWHAVFRKREYLRYDWTVKVDPDTVFLPQLLRTHVLGVTGRRRALYLNSRNERHCSSREVPWTKGGGLHGPVEVISRVGVESFARGIDFCKQSFHWQWNETGEDVFVGECLRVLKVKWVDDSSLLTEALGPDAGPSQCGKGTVAYHPLKSPESYMVCLQQALRAMRATTTTTPPPKAEGPEGSPAEQPTCSAAFEQCGGVGWTGSACCNTGCTCRRYEEYYHQCAPPAGQYRCQRQDFVAMNLDWFRALARERPGSGAVAVIGVVLLAGMVALLVSAAGVGLWGRLSSPTTQSRAASIECLRTSHAADMPDGAHAGSEGYMDNL